MLLQLLAYDFIASQHTLYFLIFFHFLNEEYLAFGVLFLNRKKLAIDLVFRYIIFFYVLLLGAFVLLRISRLLALK